MDAIKKIKNGTCPLDIGYLDMSIVPRYCGNSYDGLQGCKECKEEVIKTLNKKHPVYNRRKELLEKGKCPLNIGIPKKYIPGDSFCEGVKDCTVCKKVTLGNILNENKGDVEMPNKQFLATLKALPLNHPLRKKYEMHAELADELNDLYIRKNTNYKDSFGKTYEELGIISAVTRMTDKFNRIKALAKGMDDLIGDESLVDSLKDLANYCYMTIIELEIEKQRKEENK